MIQLSRIFENPFDTPEIGAESLRAFAGDMHAKLHACGLEVGDPHVAFYAALATAMVPVLTAFDATLAHRHAALAEQQCDTLARNEIVALIRDTIRQREGRVRDTLGKGVPGYLDFFPCGLMQYTRATLEQLPLLLDQFITAATRHESRTGSDILAEFQMLKTTFLDARERQAGRKHRVGEARDAVTVARSTLERQISLTVLELAKLHLGHPELAGKFLDQSFLDLEIRKIAKISASYPDGAGSSP